MKKETIIGMTMLAVVAFASVSQAAIDLPDPEVVGQYRVAFVTKLKVNQASVVPPADMVSLNAWVTLQAQAEGAVDDGGALDTTWSVIGATTAVDVFTNTDAEPGVDTDTPVYLVDGTLFAADLATFWSNGITVTDKPDTDNDYTLHLTEFGEVTNSGTMIQTGLTTNGVDILPITFAGHELDSTGGTIVHGGMDEGYNNNATYPWYAGASGDTWAGNWGDTGLFAISGVLGTPSFDTDLDGSGTVDDKDLNLLLSSFVPAADPGGGPEYNQANLDKMLLDFGGSSSATAAVPEPASMVLMLFGALGLLGLRRRK
ncbi:PEP-CTERM sorting domain-containing protein [Desulfobacterales bacterium HSG17]|nr:PEP-CTERM sorting domain-containing protein [Desulfobacterales bacterium HSG17]